MHSKHSASVPATSLGSGFVPDSAPGTLHYSFQKSVRNPVPVIAAVPDFAPGPFPARAGFIQNKHRYSVRLRAAALPLVLTVSVLLLLGVLALIALQERSSLFFARLHYIKTQHAYLCSGFLLYQQDSLLAGQLKENPEIILFDSFPLLSRLSIRTCRWGLYEAVTISNHNGSIRETRLLGNGTPWNRKCNFYYPDGNTRLTLTGRCALKGTLMLPRSGLLYGQMGAEFYSGEKAEPWQIRPSEERLPGPAAENLRAAAVWCSFPGLPDAPGTPGTSEMSEMFEPSQMSGTPGIPEIPDNFETIRIINSFEALSALQDPDETNKINITPQTNDPARKNALTGANRSSGKNLSGYPAVFFPDLSPDISPSAFPGFYLSPDSLRCNFIYPAALAVSCTENGPERRSLAGQIILYGDAVYLDSLTRLEDILVTARIIRIGKNFKGTAQFFARDTLLLEEGVELDYPSGIYLAANRPESYLEIGPRCKVNGYVIVNGKKEPDPKTIRLRQYASATVRGMVYIRGTARLQGIVTGSAFIERAVFHSPEGYYDHTLYNVAILENPSFAFPFWLEAPYPKKEIKRF